MVKDYLTQFALWCEKADESTQKELLSIKNNRNEIKERFFQDLKFGTAGLRGILGAGTNRMNYYTVGRATQGLAAYLLKEQENLQKTGVAISYDCRHFSEEFARHAACILAANDIHVYLYKEMQPTPALSFAVRYFNAAAGIMITASHNPANYNGYKVYGEDGAQLGTDASAAVLDEIKDVDYFSDIKITDFDVALEKGRIELIDDAAFSAYLSAVKDCMKHPETLTDKDLSVKIVYTPFHGTGYKPVMRALSEAGFSQVYPVPEQAVKDPDFSTVDSPNPENPEGFAMAIDLAREKDADLIIGTDPDSDRIGVLFKDEDGYRVLNGNETGVLLMDYVLSNTESLSMADYAVSTIVSTNMTQKIADRYGITLFKVYTGFKYIAGVIRDHELNHEKGRYLFGFEESFGYLPGTFVRDKDAVSAALLICEMTAFYKNQGMTLGDALTSLWERYGYFAEHTESIFMEGVDGMERMQKLMSQIAADPFRKFGDESVVAFRNYKENLRYDYLTGKTSPLNMASDNVLYFELSGQGFVIFRPSGTEPKIKVYFSAVGNNRADSIQKLESLQSAVKAYLP